MSKTSLQIPGRYINVRELCPSPPSRQSRKYDKQSMHIRIELPKKPLFCAIKHSQEARNDVTNKGAEQICACIVNDKMAPKFERFLNFSKQFLVIPFNFLIFRTK